VLSAGLFVAFPTFVNDMPMLNRQEIALLFFTVGLLVLVDARGSLRHRYVLGLVLAAGLTVSHYSSAGVAAALLLVAWLVRRIRLAAGRRRRTGEPVLRAVARRLPSPGPAALAMIVLVVGWSLATASAGAFAADLSGAARAIASRAEVMSDASRYGLAGARPVDDPTAVRDYAARLAADRSAMGARPAPPGCAAAVLPPDELPPTILGSAIARTGISPDLLNASIRKGVVLIFELGAVGGCALLWWRLRRRHRLRRPAVPVLAELSTAGLVLLAASVAAPQISDSYGLLRLYQQFLPILGVAVVGGLMAALRLAARRLPERARRVHAAATIVVACALLTTTGVLPRTTGDFPPQLNLANAGTYYQAYLAGPEDLAMADAVRARLEPDAWVVADSRDSVNLRAFRNLTPDEGVAPGAVPDDAYLLARLAAPGQQLATAVIGDRVVRYTFPLACVTDGRSPVMATGTHVLYSPVER
jgi:hypothetical protein